MIRIILGCVLTLLISSSSFAQTRQFTGEEGLNLVNGRIMETSKIGSQYAREFGNEWEIVSNPTSELHDVPQEKAILSEIRGEVGIQVEAVCEYGNVEINTHVVHADRRTVHFGNLSDERDQNGKGFVFIQAQARINSEPTQMHKFIHEKDYSNSMWLFTLTPRSGIVLPEETLAAAQEAMARVSIFNLWFRQHEIWRFVVEVDTNVGKHQIRIPVQSPVLQAFADKCFSSN